MLTIAALAWIKWKNNTQELTVDVDIKVDAYTHAFIRYFFQNGKFNPDKLPYRYNTRLSKVPVRTVLYVVLAQSSQSSIKTLSLPLVKRVVEYTTPCSYDVCVTRTPICLQ